MSSLDTDVCLVHEPLSESIQLPCRLLHLLSTKVCHSEIREADSSIAGVRED